MVEKVDHIGVAVNNIDDALKFYTENLGMECKDVEEVPQQKVKVAFLPVGESKIELLEPSSDESPVKKFLDKKGEGVHHIALHVDNIEKKLEELKNKGVKLIDEEPRDGAHGAKIAFIHPKSTGGTLVELCQKRN
ncbi:methylmalonyl-CoA epimerase [Natranaerofaba carboxydovora]|uniref:methylmalonyl-CoA epimerase n=1 Tax=Natranaerofaba carboxydovora TaxID=2742683 RepID=UPI001F13FDD8|nr:methylmalonyl-CoA epimerase [Natranaerofaba carboxydovora]UMZ73491.1 Lactoylglutathione lyase [Natranaerofaba carboxydovora]